MMPRNGRLTKLTPFGGIAMLACVVPDLFALTEATSNAGWTWLRSAADDNAISNTRTKRIKILLASDDT
jgi:hypothetical protein